VDDPGQCFQFSTGLDRPGARAETGSTQIKLRGGRGHTSSKPRTSVTVESNLTHAGERPAPHGSTHSNAPTSANPRYQFFRPATPRLLNWWLMMETLEFRAMNTQLLVAAEGQDWARQGLQAARTFIEQSERRFSRFLPYSELSILNRSGGSWVVVSEDLLDMLRLSANYFQETGALFDPSILPDLERVGYDRSMDKIRELGENSSLAPARTLGPRFDELELDLKRSQVRLPQGMGVDLGGIAKGWIVEKAAALLGNYSAACAVSAGGDICFIGEPMDGSKWRVQLEDPRDPAQSLALLRVGAGAVVTSSVAKRSWVQAGAARHHLIDPRTGEPACSDWLSITMLGPQITAAEAWAKALLIGGEEQALNLSTSRPEMAFIAVDRNGRLFGSQSSKVYLNDFSYSYR
jgi:FAD:protein FMN transferase